jgi:predicted DNA-binding transcriptional regulator AlpA
MEATTDRLLTLGEVAEVTRTPLETLRYWRQKGTGPTSFRIGRRVVFRERDVIEWIDAQARAQGAA